MRLPTDDAIRTIDSRWLGPRGTTLPFAARYSAWGTWAALMVVLLVAARNLGVGLHLVTVTWLVAAAVGLSWAFHRVVSHDRPVRAHARVFADELRGARPPGDWCWAWRGGRPRRR